MFDAVAAEIDERRQFLSEMKELTGQKEYAEHAGRVRREIQERVKELQRLDQLIKDMS